jgi:hypothetical protein
MCPLTVDTVSWWYEKKQCDLMRVSMAQKKYGTKLATLVFSRNASRINKKSDRIGISLPGLPAREGKKMVPKIQGDAMLGS